MWILVIVKLAVLVNIIVIMILKKCDFSFWPVSDILICDPFIFDILSYLVLRENK